MVAITDVLGGRYRLVRLLGRGGMSDVYQGIDERGGDDVAVKVVRSGDPEFVRRLGQEARALETLEHPGLVKLLDVGFADDEAFLVMQYIDGPTLARTLELGPLSTEATARLGARLADALAYVHERGIVHRDVKPSNILCSMDGEAWLGDFGIAQLRDATTITAVGTTLGTVVYMAPEQLEGHGVGPKADIWSLGIVLLECLTGRRVYEGSASEIVAQRLASPLPLPSDLPVPWKLVLDGMLNRRPEKRLDGGQVATLLATSPFAAPWDPLSADATIPMAIVNLSDATSVMPLVSDTVAFRGDQTLLVKRRPSPKRAGRSPRRAVVPSALVALGALAIGLIFWLVPGSSPPSSSTTTKPPVTTTSSTLPLASSALATLVGDMAKAQSAGSIDSGSEQAIALKAEQALTDQAQGNTNQAFNDLQQALTTVTNGVQQNVITPGEGITLQRDLTALATALGITTPITTTTAPPGPGSNPPGHGNGHGH